MWKYVSRRVKDSIELGINARKAFSLQHGLNNDYLRQQQQSERRQNVARLNHIDYRLFPQHQDPSRDKDKKDERFKKKYNRLHNNQKCLLNALKWSTAIITGFYASQLLCLYRRNQKLAIDGTKCYYSKYLLNTTQQIHRNVQYLLTEANRAPSLIPSISRFECPFKKLKRNVQRNREARTQKRTVEDEFKDFQYFVDPGYKQYDKFFDSGSARTPPSNADVLTDVFNINNDPVAPSKPQNKGASKKPEEESTISQEEIENAAIEASIRQLANIVGELELQMGIESFKAGDYEEAVDHFKLSTNHNNPGGVFNLAICYEQGVGVKRNMKTAKKLYEIASGLGHAKAFYNLGVFYAQGLGGTHKNFHQAKRLFEKAAALGSVDAIEALRLLLPQPKMLQLIEDFPETEFYYSDKASITSAVSAMTGRNLVRLAIT